MAKKKKNDFSTVKVDYYVGEIKTAWNKQVQGIIEVGTLLNQAKDELPAGSFTEMIEEKLKLFSLRTAERLMVIAEHRVLADPTHVSSLPPSWGTLYEIASKIPEDRLEQLLADGKIHADLERKEIEKIFEDVGKESAIDYEQGLQAIEVLVQFMKKPAENDTLVDLILDLDDQRDDEGYDFSLDELKELGPWISQLHIACQTELDRYKAEHPEEFWETRSLFDTPVQKDTQTPEEETQTPEEELAEVS